MRFSIATLQSAPGPSRLPPPPSRPSKTPPPRPATSGSPLPGPIRRSVAALPTGPNVVNSAASDAAAAAKSQSAKTLADSYKSLSPNTRIIFGVALGVVGLAGLYWDRWVAPEETREGDKPLVAVRVVDRER